MNMKLPRIFLLCIQLFFVIVFHFSMAFGQEVEDCDRDDCQIDSFYRQYETEKWEYACPRSARTYRTTPLLEEYVDEEQGMGRFWLGLGNCQEDEEGGEERAFRHPKVTYLYGQELVPFSPSIKDGKFYQQDGRPWETGSYGRIFIMDKWGRFFITPKDEWRDLYHSSLSGGAPVGGAGTMMIEKGVLMKLDDQSGHYWPKREFIMQVIERLKDLGISPPTDIKYCSTPE